MKPDYSFQDRDVRRIQRRFKAGVRRLLYVLPTGGGKTHVAVRMMLAEVKRGGRVLFLAHRKELVDQCAKRLEEAGLDEVEFGVIRADDKRARPDATIQVASIDTLIRRGEFPDATLIVYDEAHRAAAETRARFLSHYRKAKRLGLTATPYRLDGKGLDVAFDEIIEGPAMVELFALGVLTPPRMWSIDWEGVSSALKGVRTHMGDYEKRALAKAMNKPRLVSRYVEHYEKHGGGHRAVVFGVDRAHGRALTKQFKRAGIAVEYLDGDTKPAERVAILKRLESGETRVVVNCEILTEGWDCRAAKVCIMARPTKSTQLYLQMVGRFLRAWKGVKAIVLDHAGNVRRHDIPQAIREYALEGGLKKRKGEAPIKWCPECDAANHLSALTCVECGAEFEVEPMKEQEGELAEVRLTEEERAKIRSRVEAFASYLSARGKMPQDWAHKVVSAMGL